MSENKYIKKAEEELEYLNGDAYERRLAFLRKVAILDENTEKKAARMEGEAEGKAKGEALGKKQEKLQIAKRMLEEKIDV